jgi:hypothetical protein
MGNTLEKTKDYIFRVYNNLLLYHKDTEIVTLSQLGLMTEMIDDLGWTDEFNEWCEDHSSLVKEA